MMQTLYGGDSKRECFLTILRWAKLENYDVQIDPKYVDDELLEKEADFAIDYLNRNVLDYIYDLEEAQDHWCFFRLALDRSVLECGGNYK